jgi:hypothetical protein
MFSCENNRTIARACQHFSTGLFHQPRAIRSQRQNFSYFPVRANSSSDECVSVMTIIHLRIRVPGLRPNDRGTTGRWRTVRDALLLNLGLPWTPATNQ